MKIKRQSPINLAVAMLCALGISQAIAAPAKDPEPVKGGPIVEGFQVIAQTPEEHYTPMTPIVFSIALRNTTDKMLPFVDSNSRWMYKYEVTNEKGEAVPYTSYGKATLTVKTYTGIGTNELPAGSEKTDEVMINRYFDMSLEGRYFVKFTRLMVPKLDKSGITSVESNTVEVVVHPSIWLPKRGE